MCLDFESGGVRNGGMEGKRDGGTKGTKSENKIK